MSCYDKYLSKATPTKIKSDDRVSNFLRLDVEMPEPGEYHEDWYDSWKARSEATEEYNKFGLRGFGTYDFNDPK